MLQIFKHPNVDFMGKRALWVGLSAALVLLSAIVVPIHGIRLGIEFTGGTEIQVKYAQAQGIHEVRSALDAAGLTNAVVTTIGKPEENEIDIRLALAPGGKEADLAPKVTQALLTADARQRLASGLTDLNVVDEPSLEALLQTFPDLARDDAKKLATAIAEKRKEVALFRSVEDVRGVSGMTPGALDFLTKRTFVGPLALRGQSYIGPAIGKELIRKALFAVLGSLAGMLAYIWFRFEFQWGLAAVVALVHDTAVTLLFFSLSGKEMSLPVLAAFLTLIGYSTNDTVVVFDRIRENLKLRGTGDLVALINQSINQTLSRTIITSGLTWITVLSLFVFGGEALRPFSLVMTIGIVVGTYSSIYIASPFLVVWKHYLQRRKESRAPAAPAKGGAKKVRSTSAS